MLKPLSRDYYDNYIVLGPDGKFMFRCNKKKIKWYCERNLAQIIDAETIQLTFKTNGPGRIGDEYYIQRMTNCCVACGTDQQLSAHHIVPYCYRKHMHDSIKKNSEHDVLPLCIECHELYETEAVKFKTHLAKQYSVPIQGIWNNQKEIVSATRMRNAARALMNHGSEIPQPQRVNLINILLEESGTDQIDSVLIAAMAAREVPKSIVTTSGKLIVEKLCDVMTFIKMWRMHFVTSMKPKFMPEHWSTNREKR